MDKERLSEKNKQTGDLIFEAQEQVLRTNWIRKHIAGQQVSEKYRMCGERDESITHLIAQCKELAQKGMIILQELHTWNYARSLA